jgi:Mrp family chromosome partitioning ATPase
MRRLAITNQKGGSCKTPTAVKLAAALGELGQRLLLAAGGFRRRRPGLRVKGAVLAEAQVVSPGVDDIEGSFSPGSFHHVAGGFAVRSVRRKDLKSRRTLVDVLYVIDGEVE